MKIAYFSTSVPDPKQGGSGILNYYFAHYVLDHGHDIKAFFRVNENFLKKHATIEHLPYLIQKGLKYEFVKEDESRWKKLRFGLPFVLQQHQYGVCKKVIDEHWKQLMEYDVCFSLDLGWALALADLPLPKISLLADPLHGRFTYGAHPSYLTPRGWLHMARKFSIRQIPHWLRMLLKDFDGKRSLLGCWAPQEVKEYQSWGIPVRHYRWFSPPPDRFKVTERSQHQPKKGRFVLLHLGSLYPNASLKMMEYCMEHLFPLLAKLPFNLEVRFIGKYDPKRVMQSRWDNIHFEYLGPLPTLNEEFINADAFFSPMKYPVGVRTRIITALSYGIPVIADRTSSTGLPELVDGRDVLYGSTPEEIFEILKRLYNMPSLAHEVGMNARKAWEIYYNPEKNIPELVHALQEIA